jgi:hypothetical protein
LRQHEEVQSRRAGARARTRCRAMGARRAGPARPQSSPRCGGRGGGSPCAGCARQQGQVVQAVPQRRHHEDGPPQGVVEIRAKRAGVHGRAQVSPRRGDEPDTDAGWPGRRDPNHLRQLGLGVRSESRRRPRSPIGAARPPSSAGRARRRYPCTPPECPGAARDRVRHRSRSRPLARPPAPARGTRGRTRASPYEVST